MPQEPSEEALDIRQRRIDLKLCSGCEHPKHEHNDGVLKKCSHAGCWCSWYRSSVHDGEVDHDDTDDIICPYCGTKHSPYDGYAEGLNCEDDETEVTCRKCEGEFIARVAGIHWTFSTEPAPTDEEKAEAKEREKKKRLESIARQDEYRAKKLREGDDTFGLTCANCGDSPKEETTGRWIDPERLERFYNMWGYKGSKCEALLITWVCDRCGKPQTGKIERVQEWKKGKRYRIATYRLANLPDGPR